MTQRRIPSCAPVLLAFLSAACGDDTGGGEESAGTGGQAPTAMAGAGAGGGSGINGGSGGSSGRAGGASVDAGTDAGGAGATQVAGSGVGGATAGGPADQQVQDASDTCVYSTVRIEIEGGGAAFEASIDSWIKTSTYDRSSGSKFTIDTHDDEHLELSWQPPASKPGVVDFRGLLHYVAQDGSPRSLCFDGRVLDAFLYPVEPYYPFVATSVFEATPDGACTSTSVQATVSGCASDGYFVQEP